MSPLPAKKLGTSAVSPSLKRKVEPVASGASSQRGSNLPTPTSQRSVQRTPTATQGKLSQNSATAFVAISSYSNGLYNLSLCLGATSASEGAKSGKLSRNSSFKDNRSTPTKQQTTKDIKKQDPK